jgi:hypothetical protein
MPEGLNLTIVKAAPTPANGVILFVVLKDEDYILPFFFDYYRALGIVLFVVYDDRSGADTVDFLMAQADCVVLRSDRAFGDSFGIDAGGQPRRLSAVLKESVPESLFQRRWVLTIDADEFLVLPSGFTDLAELIDALDRIEQPYVTAPMVDFYGETLDHRNYDPRLGPFSGNPYFDAGPYYYWIGTLSPVPFVGGIRHRLLRMLCQRHPDRVAAIYGALMPGPAKSWKIPLLKHGCGIVRIADHEISLAPRAELSAAIAHFKFCPDLDAKIERALDGKQYFNGSSEYALLKTAIELMGQETLIAPETRRFEGPRSLERAGLLTAPPA